MQTVSFYTFGCRTNQAETEELIEQMTSSGWESVPFGEKSDLIIINTCTVTARSDAKVRQLIRKISSQYPQINIIITGCGVKYHKDEFEKIPQVLNTFNNDKKSDISLYLKEHLADKSKNINKLRKTRISLKIQEGCNRFCSYCIVPYVRGKPKSITKIKVLEKVKELIKTGYKEIILTGTHIGLYRDNNTKLEDLLEKICELNGDFRIRLSSIEPFEVNKRLIDLIDTHPKICRHLHISIQSLSNNVLSLMGRGYTQNHIYELFSQIHNTNPNIRVGCDIIVGFPNENKYEFKETVEHIKKIPVHYGHIFRYSPRPGTKAEKFEDSVTTNEKIRRSKIIRTIFKEKNDDFIQTQKHKIHKILIENEETKEGFTDNYLKARVSTKKKILKNHFYNIKLKKIQNGIITGTILE